MRSLLLATATLFAISCGGALAASTGGAGGGSSGDAGAGTAGGGNGGAPANAISTPTAQPPSYGVTSNQTTAPMSSTGTVMNKPSSNPQGNASASGSQ